MRLPDVINRAGRSLKNAKARTLLTSLAIGVGAFTITLSFAAGEGGRDYARHIIDSNTNVKEIYVQPAQDSSMLDPSKPREYTEGPSMNFGGGVSLELLQGEDIEKLESIDGVDVVTPIYNASAEYITRDNQKKYQSTIEAFSSVLVQDYLAGSGDDIQRNDIALPDSLRDALGFKSPEAAIGETIDVVVAHTATGQQKTYELTVKAVVESSSLAATATGMGIQADRGLIADMYEFINAGTPLADAFLGAIVLAENEGDVNNLKEAINDKGYDAQTAEDLMGFIFQFINVLQGILLGFGTLAVLTSVFGIINTQYISVLERTQQIGLMKALGMRRRDVGRLFKFEAAWIGFLGGALGAGLAAIAGTVANPYISSALGIGEISLLVFQPLMLAGVVLGLVIIAVVSGIFPARKAAKLDPIEALRTE